MLRDLVQALNQTSEATDSQAGTWGSTLSSQPASMRFCSNDGVRVQHGAAKGRCVHRQQGVHSDQHNVHAACSQRPCSGRLRVASEYEVRPCPQQPGVQQGQDALDAGKSGDQYLTCSNG